MKHKLNRLLSCALAIVMLAGYMCTGVSARERLHTDDKVSLEMILEHPSAENSNKKVPLEGARITLHPIALYTYLEDPNDYTSINSEGIGDMVLMLCRDLWDEDQRQEQRLSFGGIKKPEDYERKMPPDYLLKLIRNISPRIDPRLNIPPTITSDPSDASGKIVIKDFQCGLYLVELANPDQVKCSMKPFLATLPRVVNGEYDMTGSLQPFKPKTEITNITESVQVKKVWKGDREHFYEEHPELKPGAPSGTKPKPEADSGTNVRLKAGSGTSGTPIRPEAGSGTSGTPLWPEGTNPENLVSRPKSITIELLNDGQKTAEAMLTKKNNWTYTFENLPEDGKWSVQEQEVEGYKGEVLKMEWVKDHYEVVIVNTADGSLVQTGQLKWPVPVMLVIGCSLVLAGYVMTRDKKKTEM